MVIYVGGFKLEQQLLGGGGAVLQVGHDGRPALVLQVLVVDQAFAEGTQFVGNFKHFLEGRNHSGVSVGGGQIERR